MQDENNHKVSWKKEVAKSFLVLGNIVAGALVFGQFLNEDIKWLSVLVGVFSTLGCFHE